MSSSTPAVPDPPTPEVAALESELNERRAHLSTTIDELQKIGVDVPLASRVHN